MCYDRFDTCKVQKPPVIYDRLHDRVGIAGMYSRENPTAGIYDTMGYGTVGAMLTVMCIFCMDRMDHACLACICHHLALYKQYTKIIYDDSHLQNPVIRGYHQRLRLPGHTFNPPCNLPTTPLTP